MKVLAITTLIVAVSVRPGASSIFNFPTNAERKCIPDTRFIYDHNVCKCNSEGTEIICERGVYSSITPLFHRDQLQNATTECVPDQIFRYRCQKCLCDKSGQFATCVQVRCLRNEHPFDDPEHCNPGLVFNPDNCNGCICGADSKAACTRLQCTTEAAKLPECVPNSLGFRLECNSCSCLSDGEAVCDNMLCRPFQFHHENMLNITTECEAKNIFDYNCHECVCGDGGDYAVCYGKPCSGEKFDKTRDTREKCSPGMIFGDKCNVCVCGSDGKGVCTTNDCDITYRFE